MKPRASGFSLIEVLIALAMLGIIISLSASYLASHNDLARRTQARSEAQDKARMVLQLLTQDLQQVGSSRYVSATGNSVQQVSGWKLCAVAPVCLEGINAGATDTVRGRYIASLRPVASSCRQIAYAFDGSTLRRSDEVCGAADAFAPLADNVLALDARYFCGNSTEAGTPAGCGAGTFTRSVRVTVVVRSNDPVAGYADSTTYPTADGNSVSCPAGFFCYGATQDILMPNLKDQ